MKDVDDDDYQPSKTRIKKDLLELQTLALKLTELPGADLAGIEMGERLADAQSGKPMRKGKAYRELFKLLLAALEPGEQGPW